MSADFAGCSLKNERRIEFKMKKRILASLISLTMLSALLPTSAFASNEDTPDTASGGTGISCTETRCSHKAAIGDMHYDTIQNAINAAGSEKTTIKVLNDVNCTGLVALVGDGRDIVLDLNGHNIISSGENYTISVAKKDGSQDLGEHTSGKLEITGSGKIANGGTNSTAIRNYGEMTISGDITIGRSNGEQPANKQNSAIKCEEESTLIIEGKPTFNGYDRSLQTFGKTIIKGGIFEGTVEAWQYKHFPSTLTIEGGIFTDEVFSRTNGSENYPKGAEVIISGGKFKTEPKLTDEYVTLKDDTNEFVFKNDYYILTPKGALEFSELGDSWPDTNFWKGITKDTLVDGNLTITQKVFSDNEATVKIEGALKYAEWTAFNETTEEEQKGHYLPILIKTAKDPVAEAEGSKITVTGSPSKELTFGSDGQFELAMYMDKLADKEFTVKSGAYTYKVDCTDVVLLPEPQTNEDGSTTESKVVESGGDSDEPAQVVTETKNETTVIGSVGLPADTEDLGDMTVEVKSVTGIPADTTIQADSAVKEALADQNKTTLVEVTVKNGEEEKFTGDAPMEDAGIVVTIGGLTGGKTYFVFSIDRNGSVTSYGYKTLDENDTAISVKSSHLTIFAAAEVDESKLEEFKVAVQDDTKVSRVDEGSSGLATTDPAVKISCQVDAGAIRQLGFTGYASNLSVPNDTYFVKIIVEGFKDGTAVTVNDIPYGASGVDVTLSRDAYQTPITVKVGNAKYTITVTKEASDNASVKLRYTHRTSLTGSDTTKYFGGKLEIQNVSGSKKNYLIAIGKQGLTVNGRAFSISYVKCLENDEVYTLPCQNIFQVCVIEIAINQDLSLASFNGEYIVDWKDVTACNDII